MVERRIEKPKPNIILYIEQWNREALNTAIEIAWADNNFTIDIMLCLEFPIQAYSFRRRNYFSLSLSLMVSYLSGGYNKKLWELEQTTERTKERRSERPNESIIVRVCLYTMPVRNKINAIMQFGYIISLDFDCFNHFEFEFRLRSHLNGSGRISSKSQTQSI